MDDDIPDLHDAFSLFDKQGDGKVDSSDIGNVMRAVGLNPTETVVKKIVEDFHLTGQTRITLEEFIPLYHVQNKVKIDADSNTKSFQEAFRMFDRECNGSVNVAEVRHMLTSLGETLSPAQVDEFVVGMVDGNGMINYEDFVNGVMNG